MRRRNSQFLRQNVSSAAGVALIATGLADGIRAAGREAGGCYDDAAGLAGADVVQAPARTAIDASTRAVRVRTVGILAERRSIRCRSGGSFGTDIGVRERVSLRSLMGFSTRSARSSAA